MQVNYIYLHQGRIVPASDRLDNKNLISIIAQPGWVSDRVKIGIFQASPVNIRMGLCLQSQGLLQAEQLFLRNSSSVNIQAVSLWNKS